MLWWTSSWCSVCVHAGKFGGCSQIAQNSKVRMSRCLDTSFTTNGHNHATKLKILLVLLERNLHGHPFVGLLWSALGMHVSSSPNKGHFCSFMRMTSKWMEEGKYGSHVEEIDETCWYWRAHIISWPSLHGMHSARMHTEWNNHWTGHKNVRVTDFCWCNKNYQGGGKHHAQTVAVVLRHGRSCSEIRWKILRTGTQQDRATIQSLKSLQLYTVSHPCSDDHRFKQEELESVGELPEVCSHFLKFLHMARIGRLDILSSLNKLARSVTRWTEACDKRQARLISNIHQTNDNRQYCHVGSTAQHCRLGLFQDSDFTGDYENSKTNSWGVLCLFGSRTLVPVGCMCKKQTSVFLIAPQSLKFFLWMLDYVWMCYMLLIFGTLWLKFIYVQSKTSESWPIDWTGSRTHQHTLFSRWIQVVHLWRQRSCDQNDKDEVQQWEMCRELTELFDKINLEP